jgi:hypothetical protein
VWSCRWFLYRGRLPQLRELLRFPSLRAESRMEGIQYVSIDQLCIDILWADNCMVCGSQNHIVWVEPKTKRLHIKKTWAGTFFNAVLVDIVFNFWPFYILLWSLLWLSSLLYTKRSSFFTIVLSSANRWFYNKQSDIGPFFQPFWSVLQPHKRSFHFHPHKLYLWAVVGIVTRCCNGVKVK